MWCRRDARKSYHAAVADLGLGYGKDFIGADEPSPQHKTTGKWVREEATRLEERASDLAAGQQKLKADQCDLEESRMELVGEVAEIKLLRHKLRRAISMVVSWLRRPDLADDMREEGKDLLGIARPLLPPQDPREDTGPGL